MLSIQAFGPRFAGTGDQPLFDDAMERTARPARDARQSAARAVAWLSSRGLANQRLDGLPIGLQTSLVLGDDPRTSVDLIDVLRGRRDGFHGKVATLFEDHLGFPPAPERFSSMLLASALARSSSRDMRVLARQQARTFHDTDIDGLHGFFATSAFAGDIDCTATAARALLLTGAMDLGTEEGRYSLRRLTSTILGSAATDDIEADANTAQGKSNGRLRQHVLKVYLDDHVRHGPERDRGLKNNPAVVANALHPVLLAMAAGIHDPTDVVPLKEFHEGVERRGSATVQEIVDASIAYATKHLMSGAFLDGCRYYRSPDAFLMWFAELLHDFPSASPEPNLIGPMGDAIERRRGVVSNDPALHPWSSLNCAFRAISAQCLGLDPRPEIEHILAQQDDDGGWSDHDVLYGFGSSNAATFRSNVLTTAYCLKAIEGA